MSRPLITIDELTKALILNHNDPNKYGIPFFTGYFGMQSEEETTQLFNSFSYLRVKVQEMKQSMEQVEWQLLKFRDP